MKNFVLALAISLTAMTTAQAQQAAPVSPVRVLLGVGLTAGGDKLASASFDDGSDIDIRGGGFVHFYAGVDYRISEQFSVQGNIGYHVDDTPAASNGSISFKRIPVELLGHYRISPQWRIGAGARFVNSVKLDGSGVATNLDCSFENATGAVLEAEYLYNQNIGFKIRGVSEKYKIERTSSEMNGNHVGAYMNYYF